MNGFGTSPRLFKVSITWKNGFQHEYDQKLTVKQLESEKERYANYNWVETVDYEDLTETE